jgi:predicted RecA/RadA family phage recombinase
MQGADPRTAASLTATTQVEYSQGLTMTEKKASDGQTNLGLTRTGIFLLTNAQTQQVTTGTKVVMSGLNVIRGAAAAGDLLTGAL